MTQARRRHMARLERLAAPLLEQISLAGEQLEDEIGARIYGDALIHAANFSLIVLFGDPQIDEPVSSAWERCCKSDSPMLFDKFSNAKRLKDFGSPFDHGARRCAQYFRECAMPHLPGANDKEKFAPISAGAPIAQGTCISIRGARDEVQSRLLAHPKVRCLLRPFLRALLFRYPTFGYFRTCQTAMRAIRRNYL
jgi:hypothetical protein